ncbi:MAG: hypothetical protein Q9184_002234 [Pyrenodesmia sp. 2 TL-2023]
MLVTAAKVIQLSPSHEAPGLSPQADPTALTGGQYRPPLSDYQALESDNRQVTRARRRNQEVRERGNRGRGSRGRDDPYRQYEFWNELGGCWLLDACPCGLLFPVVLAAPAALPFQQQAAPAPSAPPPPLPFRATLQWRATGVEESRRHRGPPPPQLQRKRKNIRHKEKLAKRERQMMDKLAAEKTALEERSQQLKKQVQDVAANDDRP